MILLKMWSCSMLFQKHSARLASTCALNDLRGRMRAPCCHNHPHFAGSPAHSESMQGEASSWPSAGSGAGAGV